MKIKKIFVFLIASLLITTVPLVMAVSEDNVVISFNPYGDIDIDVDHTTYNFTTIYAATTKDSGASEFTLYNNGTIDMDTDINCSATSENMHLNETTSAPQTDEYAIYVNTTLTNPNWLNHTYETMQADYDTSLSPNDNKAFGMTLRIGTNLSANHSWQTVTVYFRGEAS
jgi:hypothetical protein